MGLPASLVFAGDFTAASSQIPAPLLHDSVDTARLSGAQLRWYVAHDITHNI